MESDDAPASPDGILRQFLKMTGRDRLKVIISLVCIFLMVSLGWYALSTVRQDKFTEFYVLNDKGQAFDYPTNLTAGEEGSLIIGLANHEGRTANYTVEVWLVDHTFVNMTVNVTHLYFVDSFNVVLNSVPYELDEDWEPQYEKEVLLNLTIPGNYSMFIMLFDDGKPVMDFNGTPLQPVYGTIDKSVDYRTDPFYTWRVVLAMRQEIPFLKLVMAVI